MDEKSKDIAEYKPIQMMPIEEMKAVMKYIAELKAAVMVAGKDYVIEKGKQYTARSGFEKLALAFRVSDDIIEETEIKNEQGQPIGWRFKVKVWQPSTGREGKGVGASVISEPNIQQKIKNPYIGDRAKYHDVYGTAHTRALNRAISNMVGSAEVSAEEMGLDPEMKHVDADYHVKEPDEPKPEKPDGIPVPETAYMATWAEEFGSQVNVDSWGKVDLTTQNLISESGLDVQLFKLTAEPDKMTVKPVKYLGSRYFAAAKKLFETAGFETVKDDAGYRWEYAKSKVT